jgi:dienelactone hydrolase
VRRLDIRLPAMAAGAAVVLLLGAASPHAQDGVTHRDNTVPGAAVASRHAGLIEEPTFLAVQGRDGHRYRLEAMIVRKMDAGARLPIALITHGKQKLAAEMAALHADAMLPQARDLAHRGYLAVAVVRRGFGHSDGTPGVATSARFAKCTVPDLRQYFAAEADDLDAALRAIAARPDADPSRVIAIGQSVGGGTVLAFAARQPRGLVAAINISGGVRLSWADGTTCAPGVLTAAVGTYGLTTRVPTLWLYAENDSLFGPELARSMRDAYALAGGQAELQMFPPVLPEGHHLFGAPEGRVKWLAALDTFLRTRALPTWSPAQVDAVLQTAGLPDTSRSSVEKYLSVYTPKVLMVAPNRSLYWTASTRDIAKARESGLENCRQRSGGECRIIMENFDALRPGAGATVESRYADEPRRR